MTKKIEEERLAYQNALENLNQLTNKEALYDRFRSLLPLAITFFEKNYVIVQEVNDLVDTINKLKISFGNDFTAEIENWIEQFFISQQIMTDNKYLFFHLLRKIYKNNEYPSILSNIVKKIEYLSEFKEMERLYQSLGLCTPENLLSLSEQIINKIDSLIQVYPNFFQLWFYKANLLLLQYKYAEVIPLYLKVLEYETSIFVKIRAINNLLVAYTETDNWIEIKAYIKTLDAEILHNEILIETIESLQNEAAKLSINLLE